ncbi:hypothetical protein [Anditalea andensis]|uniref:Uncharacterized protein n=1 Tax=Anditalea andensis TaxID=1048983 RepID=A0A074KY62_9BACT|nr:hypothetical protein [Anditalea andensis]KEO73115.1 hypothetical protein EL17_16020 [Anditalea andensis]
MHTGYGIRPKQRDLYITLPGYLQTMRLYELFSDRALNLTYSHLTGPLFEYKSNGIHFTPQLSLNQSFANGNLRNGSIAHNIGFKTMEKGYLEACMEIQNLIKYKSGFGYQGLGIGAFYRWGFIQILIFGILSWLI